MFNRNQNEILILKFNNLTLVKKNVEWTNTYQKESSIFV